MKSLKLRLQPQAPLSGSPTGAVFARFLVNEAGIDSARMRTKIEQACVLDISKYFESKKIAFTNDWVLSLIRAELAGGSFAAENIPERLKRQLINEPDESIAEFGAEMSIILSNKRSDFNYLRYSLNAVATIMGDLFKDNLLDIAGLAKKDKVSLQNNLDAILAEKLDDASTLMNWLDRVTNLHYQLIDLHGADDLMQDDKVIDRYIKPNKSEEENQKSKSYVSTKSMSTYKLRVYDYALMQSRTFLNSKSQVFQTLEFEKRVMSYENYKGLTKADLDLKLKDSKQKQSLKEKYFPSDSRSNANSNQKIVTVTESLTKQRSIQIKYSGERVSSGLIRPVLNSLRSQLLLTPKQRIFKSEVKTDESFLSVEVEALKSEDLSKVETILQLHSQ